MLRLLLILVLLPTFAHAKPAKWWDIDCDEMPIRVTGEFTCRAGETVPSDDLKLYHATRDTETEYRRYYFMTISGMRYFVPLSGRDLIEEFETIYPWSATTQWSSVESANGGFHALAVGERWSCLYHRSLHGQKQQGYRRALYLSYCRPGKHVPTEKLAELLKQIRWN